MDIRVLIYLVIFVTLVVILIISAHETIYRHLNIGTFQHSNIAFNETLDENYITYRSVYNKSSYSFSVIAMKRLIGRSSKDLSNVMNVRSDSNRTWGSCKCGAFLRQFHRPNKPLFSRSYTIVECNARGEHMCHESCIGLSLIARKQIIQDACKILENASEIHLSLSIQICERGDWLYSGLTTTQTLCCTKGKVIPCNEIECFK